MFSFHRILTNKQKIIIDNSYTKPTLATLPKLNHRTMTMASTANADICRPDAPAVPPIVRVTSGNDQLGSRQRSSHRNSPPLCVQRHKTTPPSNIMTRSCEATLSLLSDAGATAHSTLPSPRRSPRKRMSDELGLSPGVPLNDFSKKKSDDDSVLSCDDSDEWKE